MTQNNPSKATSTAPADPTSQTTTRIKARRVDPQHHHHHQSTLIPIFPRQPANTMPQSNLSHINFGALAASMEKAASRMKARKTRHLSAREQHAHQRWGFLYGLHCARNSVYPVRLPVISRHSLLTSPLEEQEEGEEELEASVKRERFGERVARAREARREMFAGLPGREAEGAGADVVGGVVDREAEGAARVEAFFAARRGARGR
jgi:hypothetical protein